MVRARRHFAQGGGAQGARGGPRLSQERRQGAPPFDPARPVRTFHAALAGGHSTSNSREPVFALLAPERRAKRQPMSRMGSCVTSIAGPNGVAQLYER